MNGVNIDQAVREEVGARGSPRRHAPDLSSPFLWHVAKVLWDGQPHTMGQVVAAVGPTIDPSEASRYYLRSRGVGQRDFLSAEAEAKINLTVAVDQGRFRRVRDHLNHLVRTGRVVMTPGPRTAGTGTMADTYQWLDAPGLRGEPLPPFSPPLAPEEAMLGKVSEAANRLLPDQPGLRPIDPDRVQRIVASVEEQGLRDDAFPILRDQHGRILSGRHRMEAEKILGVTWQRRTLAITHDEDALAVAWVANHQDGWTKADLSWFKQVGVDPRALSNAKVKRARIEIELRADAQRSDREIGEAVGADHTTVGSVRRNLEETGEIHQFLPSSGGRGKRTREPAPEGPTDIGGYVRTEPGGGTTVVSPYKSRRGKEATKLRGEDQLTEEDRATLFRLYFDDGLSTKEAGMAVGTGVTVARRLIDREVGRREALKGLEAQTSSQPDEPPAEEVDDPVTGVTDLVVRPVWEAPMPDPSPTAGMVADEVWRDGYKRAWALLSNLPDKWLLLIRGLIDALIAQRKENNQ